MSGPVLILCILSALPPAGDGLAQILARPALGGAKVAVAVADTSTGEVLFARRIDESLIPASNLKLLTSAAALVGLGPDYHFRTRLLAGDPPDAQGVVSGDVVVVGGGDPCLRADLLGPMGIEDPAAALAALLADAGVRSIDGMLVLDDSFLDREWVHPDWDVADLAQRYAAPVSALSIHTNCLRLDVDGRGSGSQPQVELVTPVQGYRIENLLAWDSGRDVNVVSAPQPDASGVITVRGRVSRGIDPPPFDIPVRDGTLLFGRALREGLAARGIPVRGGIARDGGAGRALGPSHELGVFRTHVSVAATVCNKESDNSLADHLLKVLGAEALGDGSFAGGARAVKEFLTDFVGTSSEGFVVRDGSGLSAGNRVTARGMVALLTAMNRADAPGRDIFLRSLPVSGFDGSMRDRLTESRYRGAVRAKTGYISGVSTLSGYAATTSGRVLAFSILVNEMRRDVSNTAVKAIQDDICRALVDAW